MRSLREITAEVSSRLSETSQTPFLDALLLASQVFGKSKEHILASFHEPADPQSEQKLMELAERRYHGEPAAYIIGRKEFYGYEFSLKPGVLIPRPETELVVEQAVRLSGSRPVRILDVCCGSGCIGITLDLLLAQAEVICSDISPDAAAQCRENIEKYGSRARCIESSLFENVPGYFDIIASNPPYLTSREMLDPELKARGEPELALNGGEHGLDIIQQIIQNGFDKLSQKGYLIIESSVAQTASVSELMAERGFTECETVPDLSGRGRVVIGRRA